MQVYFLVLNKVECLEQIMERMMAEGLSGATVLESTGMMKVLADEDYDQPIFGSLRRILNPERKGSKTLFIVLRDEQLPLVRGIVDEVTGGLDKPDTGIAFSVPTVYVEGLAKQA